MVYKSPLTKAYIYSQVESIMDFQIRKVKWALEELESQGEEITKWNLLEKAGIKPRYIKAILNEIQDILEDYAYKIDLF